MIDLPSFDPTYVANILGLAGVIFLLDAMRQTRSGPKSDKSSKTKRLQTLSQDSARDEVHLLRARPAKSLWAKLPLVGDLPAKMQQAGLEISPRRLMLICAFVSTAALFAGVIMLDPLAGVVIALTVGLGLPLAVIEYVRQKRVATFAAQLPEALELMSRGLSVGHPLNVSIGNVAKSMPDPIGGEFRHLADQISYGEELSEALQDLARRIDQEDMHYLAASVTIQHGTGGNLSAMLGTLARVIRGRYALRRRVKAISSEGRASAKLLSALPIGLYLTTSVTSPEYYSGVSDEPMFLYMAIAVVTLVVSNALILTKLVNFRI